MIAKHQTITILTRGKGTYEITGEVAQVVRESGVRTGTVTVFIRHTSASLVIYENADPSARTDLHNYFEAIAPEDGDYVHTLEGPRRYDKSFANGAHTDKRGDSHRRRTDDSRNLAGDFYLRASPRHA